MHKVARDANDPDRLYLQHHGGIYSSENGGDSWEPMTSIAGMDFGFPVVSHPTRPGTAYLLPLESDEYRCTPDGHCIVWKTEDGGETWRALTDGLPQRDAHLTILRDGFTTDGLGQCGLVIDARDRCAKAGRVEHHRRERPGKIGVDRVLGGAEDLRYGVDP